jgi:hypothetical protein
MKANAKLKPGQLISQLNFIFPRQSPFEDFDSLKRRCMHILL